jgi:hypothetical protein
MRSRNLVIFFFCFLSAVVVQSTTTPEAPPYVLLDSGERCDDSQLIFGQECADAAATLVDSPREMWTSSDGADIPVGCSLQTLANAVTPHLNPGPTATVSWRNHQFKAICRNIPPITTTTTTTTIEPTAPQTAYLKTCRWKSTQDRLVADSQHLVGWTCADNEIITGFGINADEDDVSKIQCCDLGGHSSVIPETCSFIKVGDQEFGPERASCSANDHLMVFSGAYDASTFDDDEYTEILVGKCCEVKCDAPWCQGKDWGINTDQCVTISADAENNEAQELVCPEGTVVTQVIDGHSGAALGIQEVASVVCCELDVISQPTSAPSQSPTTTKPTYAPSRSPSKTPSTSPSKAPTPSPTTSPSPSPTNAPSQAPTSTANCLLALFQCDPPLSDAEILQGIDDCLPNCMVPSEYVVRRALEGRLLKNAE